MKKTIPILLLFFVLLTRFAAADTTISFSADSKGVITLSPTQSNYTLPLTLSFPAALLKGKRYIGFYGAVNSQPAAQRIAIAKLKPVNGSYLLTVDTKLNISPCSTSQGSCMINTSSFFIKIDTTTVSTVISTGSAAGTPAIPSQQQQQAATATNATYGNAYYDAFTLSKLTADKDAVMIARILQYYNLTTVDQLNANPFFKTRFATIFDPSKQTQGTGNAINGVLQSAGDLDVTNIADGLAKFIVARMKEELSTAFFNKFKKEMDSTPEGAKFKILFPTTYQALSTMGDQIYNYSAYIDLLRESFQKDLTLLIPDLRALVDDGDFLAQYPDVKTALSDGLYIADQFNGGAHPGDVLNDYVNNKADATALGKINPAIYPSLQTLNVLSQSLRSKYGKNYWVSADSVQLLFSNQDVVNIYFGLLYQNILKAKGGNIVFNGKNLTDLMSQGNNIVTVYTPFLSKLGDKAKAVDMYFQAIKQSSQAAKNQPDYQDYYGMVNAAADLLKLLETIPLPSGATAIDQSTTAKVNMYLDGATEMANVYVDLYYKQYPAAIMEIGTVFNNTILLNAQDKLAALNAQLKTEQAPVTGDSSKKSSSTTNPGAAATQAQIKDLQSKQKWVAMLTKYGNFIATVVKAQNSDDVQNAIEAVAMPAGSSSVKRLSVFNVALNAYIGPFYGNEKIHGFDKKSATAYGLTAPVGVSASFGNFITKGMSISLFVPLIDLGAIASYRAGHSTTVVGTDTLKASNIPQVQLKNIVSPGLFLSLGIPGLPISVSGGYQLAPTLRSITVVNSQNQVLDPNQNGLANQYASKMYSRWSISLVVDIPILNFYTRGK